MKKLYYVSGHVVVSDSICAAVIDYARALGETDRSDLVRIPALSDEGARGEAVLLIGPSSELFVAAALDRAADLDDDEAVNSMRLKIAALRPPAPQTEDRAAVESYVE